jgi:hypothetical protein
MLIFYEKPIFLKNKNNWSCEKTDVFVDGWKRSKIHWISWKFEISIKKRTQKLQNIGFVKNFKKYWKIKVRFAWMNKDKYERNLLFHDFLKTRIVDVTMGKKYSL